MNRKELAGLRGGKLVSHEESALYEVALFCIFAG